MQIFVILAVFCLGLWAERANVVYLHGSFAVELVLYMLLLPTLYASASIAFVVSERMEKGWFGQRRK